MERILRSVIQVGNVPDAEDAFQNWTRLVDHNIEFPVEEDRRLFVYLKTFYSQMSAPPDIGIIREYFEKQDDIEVVSRLEEVKKAQHYIRTNFLAIVRSEQESQLTRNFILLCRDATGVAEHGRNLEKPVNGKRIIRGVHDAVNYLYENLSDYTRVESGEKLEGVITDDVDEVLEEYDIVATSNVYNNRNIFGLEPVDSSCEGHRSGELWVHCGFPGELKTTLALNYAYNNAYIFGRNIFYAILEMPYKQLRRQLYVLHSSHGKFVTEWYHEDRKAGREPYLGIDYRKVRDGKLNPLEWERFKKVAQDFRATSKGKLYVWRPETAGAYVSDIQRRAEMFHNKFGCDGIVVDHMGMTRPKFIRTDDISTRMNAVVTEHRWMALTFARGKTVPVLGLFHMNRQGKMRADKNDGRYDFAAISYANQIEKDADVITYTYLNDQLRRDGKFYLGNIKNRDNPVFDRMIGKILWQSKRMRAIESGLLDTDADRVQSALNSQNFLAPEDMLT
jgi:replicative DNA helicase